MEGDSGMGGFYHLSGKEPKHKGHEVHKGKKSLDFTGFSFVASPALHQTQCGASVVTFVVRQAKLGVSCRVKVLAE
ncbi:MAG: hypothetical protein A3K41_03145 [Chloroflexi bacterium RIFOXYD12_FULL_57_15]|nr:MAG: hypothetical protein A3K41_03145 [Chloroflexi bacterium RIFOXYD12_FULL_57_15]